jgi:AraC family transcriptional regulator
MQQPVIQTIQERILAGLCVDTTLATINPAVLWQQFMPRRKELKTIVGIANYAVQVYDPSFVKGEFNNHTAFQNWAAVEVEERTAVPEGMATIIVPPGQYAVFLHKGPASEFYKTAQYIFGEWLPNASYSLDDRPHLQIMGEKYLGPDNPESVEEVWIPVK